MQLVSNHKISVLGPIVNIYHGSKEFETRTALYCFAADSPSYPYEVSGEIRVVPGFSYFILEDGHHRRKQFQKLEDLAARIRALYGEEQEGKAKSRRNGMEKYWLMFEVNPYWIGFEERLAESRKGPFGGAIVTPEIRDACGPNHEYRPLTQREHVELEKLIGKRKLEIAAKYA